MSEEECPEDHEEISDDVLMASASLVRSGSLDRTEREMISKYNMTQEEAQDAVAEAAAVMIASSPKELRQSFEAVCSYHRWNFIFEEASRRQDIGSAMAAQKQLDALMRGVH